MIVSILSGFSFINEGRIQKMAILIVINNKEKYNSQIFYTVSYTDVPNLAPFKIGIDMAKNLILFFKNTDTSKPPIKIIDLNNPDEIITDFEIPRAISGRIIMRILACLRDNNFPDDISYSA